MDGAGKLTRASRGRCALVVGLALAGILMAPAGYAEGTNPVGFFPDLWEMAKTGGPFVTCFCLWQWQLERRDRLKLQGERDALLERMLTVLTQTIETIKDTKRAIERSG